MRNGAICLLLVICSISAYGTSYSTGEVAGFFGWYANTNSGGWTPRIPALPYYPGLPDFNPYYMYPTHFDNATLSVTCDPSCAVGNTFALSLTMSNFSLTGPRPYRYPDLNIFVGTLTQITRPILLKSASGIAIARFSLTGDLLGCTDATCSSQLFSLAVNTHAYATISYSLANGQLSITSVGYSLPEPSSMALLGTGLLFVFGKCGKRVAEEHGARFEVEMPVSGGTGTRNGAP